ncbi:concanavalin A-like lectin/glucanase domain-containing protein [Glomus cerebriforme]|uniref:Concanavalin A-like lectin/glucanase domain-containing protein n=1 Tax=Glomus cerebriforme TaxID=658196 RepID=A0A397TL33_9GLOM|nr:concanavalin A-like lectin/glucanase domain-containing protein [Glomus cerebriforme]
MKINNPSPRGKSLEGDLRRVINDENFHDIALKCSDGKIIYGCKAILATRSDFFYSYIFTKSKNNNKFSFDDINSTAMKIILEFLYTSKVEEEKITVSNGIEAYYASIYFDLIDLQDLIIGFIKKFLMVGDDVGKKLLSECVEKFSLKVDNEISKILVDWVAKNKLEKTKIDSLSLEGLRYLLEKTFKAQIPFATPEFDIWQYALKKVTRKIVQNESLVEKILDEKSFSLCNSQEIKEIKIHLNTLIRYIDLKRMDAKEIDQHVAPFEIYSAKSISDGYRSISLDEGNEEGLGFIRGVPIFKWKIDRPEQTSRFLSSFFHVPNDGFTVTEQFNIQRSITGNLKFKGRGVYEWNILIENLCKTVYIGICNINDDLRKNDQGYHGWVLGSDGYAYHEGKWKRYDAKYKEGDKVTVHLDMKKKTCGFSINNNKKFIVSEWKNIPSQVYPVVSLGHGSKLRIEPINSSKI